MGVHRGHMGTQRFGALTGFRVEVWGIGVFINM